MATSNEHGASAPSVSTEPTPKGAKALFQGGSLTVETSPGTYEVVLVMEHEAEDVKFSMRGAMDLAEARILHRTLGDAILEIDGIPF